MAPLIAAAATVAGLARCVRDPAPCRPSKFRLDVDRQRSPGPTLSELAAAHKEQADSCHSKPDCLNIRSKPSASAARFTSLHYITTRARTWPVSIRTSMTAAADCISVSRLYVQEP